MSEAEGERAECRGNVNALRPVVPNNSPLAPGIIASRGVGKGLAWQRSTQAAMPLRGPEIVTPVAHTSRCDALFPSGHGR